MFVGLPYQGQHAHFLRLVDMTEATADNDGDGLSDLSDPDDDNDGLPDAWETANSLSPTDATGDNGPDGDPDGDGATNYEEWQAGTDPNDPNDVLSIVNLTNLGPNMEVQWDAVPDYNYAVETLEHLTDGDWQQVYFGTAYSSLESLIQASGVETTRAYRVRVKP